MSIQPVRNPYPRTQGYEYLNANYRIPTNYMPDIDVKTHQYCCKIPSLFPCTCQKCLKGSCICLAIVSGCNAVGSTAYLCKAGKYFLSVVNLYLSLGVSICSLECLDKENNNTEHQPVIPSSAKHSPQRSFADI